MKPLLGLLKREVSQVLLLSEDFLALSVVSLVGCRLLHDDLGEVTANVVHCLRAPRGCACRWTEVLVS